MPTFCFAFYEPYLSTVREWGLVRFVEEGGREPLLNTDRLGGMCHGLKGTVQRDGSGRN